MILLDTCVLIFDALSPERLSTSVREALACGESEGKLACADISLWEIAMLIGEGRLDPGTEAATFCRLALDARGVQVLPITPVIAAAALAIDLSHADPADRLIVATARTADATLLTCDERLRVSGVKTLW